MTRRNTSVRFTDDEYELIDAVAAALSVSRGIPHGRADVFRTALRRLTPPEGATEELGRWRRAYNRVFPGGSS